MEQKASKAATVQLSLQVATTQTRALRHLYTGKPSSHPIKFLLEGF